MQLPSNITSGQQSRLFSSLKLSNKELIATSTILAVFRLVPELLAQLIKDTGVTINDRTVFDTFTEVSVAKPQGNKKDRPDGFIYIKNRNEWTALVESKVGNNLLQEEQVTRYVEDARANGIGAVITISNEFTPRVEQSPVNLPKRLLNRVKLYHLSWRLILSTATLLKNQNDIRDREKSFVLGELIRFLRDDSVGNKNFSIMPASWVDVCNESSMGARFRSSDQRISEVASSLVEEFSEIALNLADHLGVDCRAKISNSFNADRSAWQRHIVKNIIEKKSAMCAYDIPNAANSLVVEIDLAKNIMSVGMEIKVPEDRSTLSGKINFVLRQIRNIDNERSFAKIRWRSRAADEYFELNKLEPTLFKDRAQDLARECVAKNYKLCI